MCYDPIKLVNLICDPSLILTLAWHLYVNKIALLDDQFQAWRKQPENARKLGKCAAASQGFSAAKD